MKLRNKLFISTSALLSVALLGLLLGVVSVLQLTQSQNLAMTRNLGIIDASLGLRQELGKQLVLLLAEDLDLHALQISDQRIRGWIHQAEQSAMTRSDYEVVAAIDDAYGSYRALLTDPLNVRRELLNNDVFGHALEHVRNRINEVQLRYVAAVQSAEKASRERAWLVSGLLGLVGLTILVIGFITAHIIARRVGQPIDALARAADQIGRGDFDVSLPQTPVLELASLSHRFVLMAQSLRQFQSSNVDALLAEQRRLQAVLDSIDDGLLIFGRNGLLEHFNPIAQRQLGWKHQPLGQGPGRALEHDALDEQLQVVLQGRNLEHRLDDLQVRMDGETRLLSYSLTPVCRSEGDILGAVMVLRDVTEQRAFERIRNEFILRASHELRTPITGMHMAFCLLREHGKFPDDSREADLVRTVDEEMERLVQLIEDLLNFSRYQNGMHKLELAPCAIPGLLEAARQRNAHKGHANILVALQPAEVLPHVLLDRVQINRVLDHLIENALRHSPEHGEVRLQATCRNDCLQLSVIDAGEGIAYGQQARLFEPFVQIGRKKGGAGLGLALCKEIVRLHSGRISVESQPGQGTCFHVALPL
jgi:NtrC-family two-component system sensor histidine kinase KinB